VKRENSLDKMDRKLGDFFDKRFHSPHWREQERKFWEEKLRHIWIL